MLYIHCIVCSLGCVFAVSKPATIAPAPATIRHIAPVSGSQTPLKIALSQTQQVSPRLPLHSYCTQKN